MIQEEHVQETAAAAERAVEEGVNIGELMMHHTADLPEIELEGLTTIHLPQWGDIAQFGSLHINMSPTKHLVYMVAAAILVFLTMWLLARTLTRQQAGQKAPRGLANVMESFVLWVREEICIQNIGEEAGARFAPFILTIFFFILYGNLMGLVPWGASFTGNLAVTAAMAAMAFLVIEVSGMRALGFGGYMRTIFPKVEGMGGGAGVVIAIAMAPIELIGKVVKPFALCFRLFGNITAGHFVVVALLGLIFLATPLGNGPTLGLGIISAGVVSLIMLLELLVAFVQAYVFAIITAVLIGMNQHAH